MNRSRSSHLPKVERKRHAGGCRHRDLCPLLNLRCCNVQLTGKGSPLLYQPGIRRPLVPQQDFGLNVMTICKRPQLSRFLTPIGSAID